MTLWPNEPEHHPVPSFRSMLAGDVFVVCPPLKLTKFPISAFSNGCDVLRNNR